MNQKLRGLERTAEFLRYHRYACIVAAGLIVAMCVSGAIRYPARIQKNIEISVLGVGCCVFSMLWGIRLRNTIQSKLQQYKSKFPIDDATPVNKG